MKFLEIIKRAALLALAFIALIEISRSFRSRDIIDENLLRERVESELVRKCRLCDLKMLEYEIVTSRIVEQGKETRIDIGGYFRTGLTRSNEHLRFAYSVSLFFSRTQNGDTLICRSSSVEITVVHRFPAILAGSFFIRERAVLY